MKFDKRYRPELCASKDENRPHLRHTYLDAAAGRMFATDGHRLVIVPVEVDKSDVAGQVSAPALSAARRSAPKPSRRNRRYCAAGESDGRASLSAVAKALRTENAAYRRPVYDDAPVPYMKVVPKGAFEGSRDGVTRIAFNARYLYEMALALGADAKAPLVEIEVSAEPLSPIVVRRGADRPNGEIGVLMPARVRS